MAQTSVAASESITNAVAEAYRTEHDVCLSIRRGLLRFSLHVYNTPKDVEHVLGLAQRWLRG